MDRATVIKYLRDAIPAGDRRPAHATWIDVRLDVVRAAAAAIEAVEASDHDIFVHNDGIDVWGAKSNPELEGDPNYTRYRPVRPQRLASAV